MKPLENPRELEILKATVLEKIVSLFGFLGRPPLHVTQPMFGFILNVNVVM